MIILSFFICFFSCNQIIKGESQFTTNADNSINSNIVFIFKKNFQKNSSYDNKISVLGSSVFYSEKNNFTSIDLNPNNSQRNDTIVKTISADKICLTYTFNKVQKFIYEFQKGDTVVFDYEKGYPYASVINRQTLKFDNNFLADIKIEKPLEDFQFMIKYKRIRNDFENKIYYNELKNYTLLFEKSLDSIFRLNLISQSNYEMYKSSNKFFEINTNKELLKSISLDDLKRDDLLYLKTYRHFLNNYVVSEFKLKTSFNNDPMTCNSNIAFDSIVKSYRFSKRVKESLLYAHLVNIAEKNSTADLNKYFKKFQNLVDDTVLSEKITNNYLLDFTSLKKETKEVYFISTSKNMITLESLIASNKGKIIFVDFWASWCAPCRVAMKSSIKLKKEFKDKEVVFIYISIDSDFEKWKVASENEKLFQKENNLLALNYPDAIFYKELKLKTIPRYIIYDKSGKLIHQNAPSPETTEIRDELNKYLED